MIPTLRRLEKEKLWGQYDRQWLPEVQGEGGRDEQVEHRGEQSV